MKKLLLPVLLLIVYSASGQNNQVEVNSQPFSQVVTNTNTPVDIGGVSSEYFYTDRYRHPGFSREDLKLKVQLTNDNSFSVTCSWTVSYSISGGLRESEHKTGTTSLQPGETKLIYQKAFEDIETNNVPVPAVLTQTRRLANGVDEIAELKKFKQLLDEGIITQDEFYKKKKELLGL